MTTAPGAVGTGPEGFMYSSSNTWSNTTAKALRTASGNDNLKVMAAVGGWALEQPFNEAVRNNRSDQFVAYCVDFVKKYDLDGIDLDWE